ncbi:putative bifunctional diguanylate cyclase/phosphodiesterase [Gorillibacterium sp. sgz5001074]|uniref:putative bifunctional diguanylate cyclase/phosphodiesterase n=1 Tax=Gorillibacterium sp. sgz5001074 TaxID=3446695 RepID=UPI003F6729CF
MIPDSTLPPEPEPSESYRCGKQALPDPDGSADPVTGLPDGRRFPVLLDRYVGCGSHRPACRAFALVLLDLDRFRSVNLRYGHRLGDLLLAETARRLTACSPEGTVLYRYSGDQFYLIVPGMGHTPELCRRLKRMLAAVSSPFMLDGEPLTVSASAGVSLYPYDGPRADELMHRAVLALHAAKKHGGGCYRMYLPEMRAASDRVLSIESELSRAVSLSQLTVYYQPIVELDTGKLTGAEALLRWSHPRLGDVPPSAFIPAAEQSDLMVPIGGWVLEEACSQLAAWIRSGHADLELSVNVSAAQLAHPTFGDLVEETVRKHGLPPSSLMLEITESMPIGSTISIEETLQRLKRFGIRLALDDFGTGYSSYSCLVRYPFHTLKIDRSLLPEALCDPKGRAMLASLISMARSLGMRAMAEGVETEEQRQCLNQLGCGFAQGFLFSPPVPASRFASLLERSAP